MGDAAVYDLAAVVAERDALRKDFEAALAECKLLTHKVITCGVAASHPDASLAHTGVYKEKWDSPQAEEVRKLRAERDALAKKLAAAEEEAENLGLAADSYWKKMNASEAEVARLKSALSESDVAVQRLRAACAAKDAALSKALGYVDLDNDALISKCLAALKCTAGTGWIDATGAVNGKVAQGHLSTRQVWTAKDAIPDDWAGATVLVVRKP